MKIIHVLLGKASPSATMNGVNVVVDRYANIMHERGYDVEVWGITYKPHSNLPKPKYPIKLFQRNRLWPSSLDKGLIGRLGELDQARTVMHFHGGFILEFPKMVKYVKDLRYFVMPHGIYHERAISIRAYRKALYTSLVEAGFVSRSSGLVLYHYDEIAPSIQRKLRNTSCEVIPKGPDNTLVTPTNVLEITEQGPVVWGFCGRICNRQKNINRIIECFSKFREERNKEKHVLSIVGDGQDLPAIRERFAGEIESKAIEIHGAQFGEHKIRLLKKMHYFIHLSNWETVPLSCIDALKLGIPLLVTPETLMAEDVMSHNAGMSTTLDNECIVGTMHRLFSMKREALFQGCRELVANKYDDNRAVDKLIALYTNALTIRKQSP